MKDWKAVLLTLILLALCVVPCVAMAVSKESVAEPEAVVTGYSLRDTISEESTEDSAVFSFTEVGILLVAGAVITVMCTVLPQMEKKTSAVEQL